MSIQLAMHQPGQGFDINIAIENIAHWLPTQGPIKDFIHHNTLHAVQHLPFHQGVAAAAKIFGARSYLPLSDYQQRYQQGRITDHAIDWALKQTGLEHSQTAQLREKLFQLDPQVHYPPVSLANHGFRNTWLTHLEVDLNSLVHPILFRLWSSFLDQGISRWTLAKPEERFWDCVWRLAKKSAIALYPFDEPLSKQLLDQSPNEVIAYCLDEIVGNSNLYEQYLLEMLLAHPGWSGMIRLIELNPTALLERRQISLKEAIAVELLAELAVLRKYKGQLFEKIKDVPHIMQRPLLNEEILNVDSPIVLKVWHEAMEYSLHTELMIALKAKPATATKPTVSAQAIFCIDDRECSLRRYLEEIDPSIETFGAAGFFGIDFFYQGIDDAYPVAQCPNIITPKHLIVERGTAAKSDPAALKTLADLHVKPHSIFKGWLFTQVLGIAYALRMVWDVFRPNSQLLRIQKLSDVDHAHSQLHLLRENDEPTADGKLLGFSHQEMADKLEGLLRNIGLTKTFASLVVVVAHGSSSTNNPHFAAYDCGACSGKPGAPNARAFAAMANDAIVRDILKQRGIDIPINTRFVPALHNTSRDEVSYFDLNRQNPIAGLRAFEQTMHQALDKNALERCRWFELAPKSHAYEQAHQHVIARATSIFEPRPELNHSNNLYCVVGRRTLTSGLFLDRRSFLHSYDPQSDEEAVLIVKILSAIIPVCGGINLEYLFSRIDNTIYGAGTKLPHNVISLLGVANGVEGDLRTGLPSQMIEVHEPARLLIVIEQYTQVLDKAFANLGDALMEWLNNDWVRLVACHPNTREMSFYHASGWEKVNLPTVSTPQANDSEAIIQGEDQTIPVHILKGAA